jgi:hypothetical protein
MTGQNVDQNIAEVFVDNKQFIKRRLKIYCLETRLICGRKQACQNRIQMAAFRVEVLCDFQILTAIRIECCNVLAIKSFKASGWSLFLAVSPPHLTQTHLFPARLTLTSLKV